MAIDWSQINPRVLDERYTPNPWAGSEGETQYLFNGDRYYGEQSPYRAPTWRDFQAEGLWKDLGDPNGAFWRAHPNGMGPNDPNQIARSLLQYVPSSEVAQAFAGQNLPSGLAGEIQGTTEAGRQDAASQDFLQRYGEQAVMAAALAAVGGSVFGNAGVGSASAGGTAAAPAAADYASFLGPATGTIESAPMIGAAGAPTVSAVASGAGPFVPVLGGLTGVSNAISGALGKNGVGNASGGGTGLVDDGSTLAALARGIPGLLGAYGASRQTDAYKDLANKYMEMGGPSRGRFEGSFAPGFTMANDPGYSDALNQTAKATLHGLSVNGNPADSPNAWSQTLSDLYQKTAYPALQNYRNTNAGAGGLAQFAGAAPGAASNAITSQGNIYNAIGAGAADIFNPPKSLAQIFKEMRAYA